MEPRPFGKYTLVHHLARGGMADLYLARSSEVAGIERLLVIKLVARRYSLDSAFVSMFQDEVRIAATLAHPNIGQVIEVGQVENAYYLAMEHIHGRDLRQVLKRCMLKGAAVPVSAAVPIGVRICAALQHAHDSRGVDGRPLNVVHRDVSLSNIMITYEGQVKLVDFGIAKAANRTAFTVPGTIKGKLRYLSPEQVLGHVVDRRTDVFGLGVCLWEATVGQHCFEGPSDAHIYEAIAKGRVRPPRSVLASYPADLERILLRALSAKPDDRHPSAQALQLDLESFATANGIVLSDLSLARFMQETFADEFGAWQRAQREGRSLVDHLQELTHKSVRRDEVLLAGGGTPPSSETPASGSPLAPYRPAALDLPQEPARKTEAPRRTIAYGQLTSPAVSLPKPPPPVETAALQVSEARPVEVRLDDRGEMISRPGAADQRRTVIVGTGLLSAREEDNRPTVLHPVVQRAPLSKEELDRHDTLIEPSAAEVLIRAPTEPTDKRPSPVGPHTITAPDDAPDPAAPRPREPVSLDSPPGRAPGLERARSAAAPEPIIARDREELEHRRQAQTEPEPTCEEPRAITGDWSAQASGERRAGTHPYFKEPGPVEEEEPARNRLPLIILLVLGVLVMSAAATLGWFYLRRGSPSVEPPRVRLAQVESEPRGATVFDAADGRELGLTPLRLELAAGRELRVELHLAGFRRERLALKHAGRHRVALTREAAEAGSPPPRAAPDSGSARPPAKAAPLDPRRRPSGKKVPAKRGAPGGDLMNPFD